MVTTRLVKLSEDIGPIKLASQSSIRWLVASVIIPIVAAMLAAGSYYWDRLGEFWHHIVDRDPIVHVPDVPNQVGIIELNDVRIAGDVSETICDGTTTLRFLFKREGGRFAQTVFLKEPVEHTLDAGDTKTVSGCSIQLVRVERDSEPLGVFKLTWKQDG